MCVIYFNYSAVKVIEWYLISHEIEKYDFAAVTQSYWMLEFIHRDVWG